MRFVVTGSNGFIGQNTCRRLAALGHDVIGVDDLSSGTPPNGVSGVRYHTRSVVDADWLVGLLKDTVPDAILHLAAKAEGPVFGAESAAQRRGERDGERCLFSTGSLKAELAEKTRLVFASSSAIFGDATAPPDPGDVTRRIHSRRTHWQSSKASSGATCFIDCTAWTW